jgi:hypothetical protein
MYSERLTYLEALGVFSTLTSLKIPFDVDYASGYTVVSVAWEDRSVFSNIVTEKREGQTTFDMTSL